jgi:hypothetical protein
MNAMNFYDIAYLAVRSNIIYFIKYLDYVKKYFYNFCAFLINNIINKYYAILFNIELLILVLCATIIFKLKNSAFAFA